MTHHIFALRGTSETLHSKQSLITRAFTQHGPTDLRDYAFHDIAYPASITVVNERRDLFGASLAASLDAGVWTLKQRWDLVKPGPDDTVTIVGYSLGALVALRALKQGLKPTKVILVANPSLRVGKRLVPTTKQPPSGYYGISADILTDAVPSPCLVFNVAHPEDPIVFSHPKSPLRRIAPWLWYFDVDEPGPWLRDLQRRVVGGEVLDIRFLFSPGYRQALDEAPNDLLDYAIRGRHTRAYEEAAWTRPGMTPTTGLKVIGNLMRPV
ncbi:lysin B [Gordonia phage Elinal]|nr:lysin B [Gordonia phage Elinal]